MMRIYEHKSAVRTARPRGGPLPRRHRRRPRQAGGQRRRHERRGARRLPRRPPPGHRRGARAAADRGRGQRARRRPRLRRDLPPDRPPAAGALRRGAAHRRRLGGRRRDGRTRATRASSSSRRSRSCPDAQAGAPPAHPRRCSRPRAGSVATELPDRLGVSGHTVRRDLDELAEARSLQRVHGGALARSPVAASYEDRQVQAVAGKIATARAAATLLEPRPGGDPRRRQHRAAPRRRHPGRPHRHLRHPQPAGRGRARAPAGARGRR